MDTTLLIMAACIGSRFGGGIKQLEPVGPSGEIIMDYSIHDALEAGFNKVVFIIRKDLEKDFREIIGNRMEKLVETAYAFQEIDDLPAGFTKPADRTKPWGTGQAILSCKDLVLRVLLFLLPLGLPGRVLRAPVAAGRVPVRAVRCAYRLYHTGTPGPSGTVGFPAAAQCP